MIPVIFIPRRSCDKSDSCERYFVQPQLYTKYRIRLEKIDNLNYPTQCSKEGQKYAIEFCCEKEAPKEIQKFRLEEMFNELLAKMDELEPKTDGKDE